MAARQRNSVARSASSESQMTYSRFLALFPDNDACLEYLRGKFFPDGSECPGCGKPSKFFRIKSRAAYSCMYCRQQVYPTAGTIFHKSTVSLQLWFFAIYLMASTRCGISAKQLEREIGVTYKTAHRIMKKIREGLMTDVGDEPLSGDVEIDETSVRGKPRVPMTRTEAAAWREAQPKVLGMVERGGRVRARVIPSRRGPALSREVRANVNPSSILFTDDWQAYKPLRRDYLDHRIINHSAGLYVDGTTHTNTIEGFFGNLKTGMRGAYKKVSPRYLQSYLNEYVWRYNQRQTGRALFQSLLARAAS